MISVIVMTERKGPTRVESKGESNDLRTGRCTPMSKAETKFFFPLLFPSLQLINDSRAIEYSAVKSRPLQCYCLPRVYRDAALIVPPGRLINASCQATDNLHKMISEHRCILC